MNNKTLFTILVVLLVLQSTSSISYNQTVHWYSNQLIDHFDPLNTNVWSQRYYAIEDFFDPSSGNVFLYICGEAECQGLLPDYDWLPQIAQQFNALVLSLEHRYYGSSMPFGQDSLKTAYMKYLSVEQALADLARFLVWIKETGQHRATSLNPWIIVGGSYAGAMSAWFREKYPHLTVGAWASSPVVNAILRFDQFDQWIRTATSRSGDWCPQAIHDVNFYAESLLQNDETRFSLLDRFNATKLKNGEFMFFFADFFVEQVQYGSRVFLCNSIANLSSPQIIDWVESQVKQDPDMSPNDYSSYYLSNETVTNKTSGGRQWTYQYCSEFGWFQICPNDTKNSMRGTNVSLYMYESLCQLSFLDSSSIIIQAVNQPSLVNTYYGGTSIKATNIIIENSSEDPWQKASIVTQMNNTKSAIVLYNMCDSCGHCNDLDPPADDEPTNVKNNRKTIIYLMRQWIEDYWNTQQTSISVKRHWKSQ